MCENLFDGVSQPINVCEQCGKRFEGTENFCSSRCETENEIDEMNDRWDD